MRKLLITICLLLVCSTAQAKNFCLDANAVGCWLMTEGTGTTIDDVTANSYTGTFQADGHPAWDTTDVPFSVSGSALNSLNSSTDANDYIDFGAVAPNSGAISITLWEKTTDGQVGAFAGRIFDTRDGSGNGFFFGVLNDLTLRFFCDGATGLNVITSTTYSADTWTHLAVTWDGSTTAANVHIYINGVEASYGTQTNGATLVRNTTASRMNGSNSAAADVNRDANWTDFGLFTRVLSAGEILKIKNHGLNGRRVL